MHSLSVRFLKFFIFRGVHLTDLTFIDENPDFLHGPNNSQLINFSKRKLIYSVISQIQQLQQHAYNLHPVYQIAYYLTRGMRISDDQTMYQLSLQREPRKAKLSEIQ